MCLAFGVVHLTADLRQLHEHLIVVAAWVVSQQLVILNIAEFGKVAREIFNAS